MKKAGAATNRRGTRLREEAMREKPVEIRFSLPEPWTRQMLIALCQRYGLAALSLSAHAAAKCHGGDSKDILSLHDVGLILAKRSVP